LESLQAGDEWPLGPEQCLNLSATLNKMPDVTAREPKDNDK